MNRILKRFLQFGTAFRALAIVLSLAAISQGQAREEYRANSARLPHGSVARIKPPGQ